jgi:release factor glutamine methyltransferase
MTPAEFAGLSIADARRALRRKLEDAGIGGASLDARILIGDALALEHRALISQANRELESEEARIVAGLASRRLAREPIARIVGKKEFWGLTFELNRHAFIPRPETETVVEAALAAVANKTGSKKGLRIADLGTGSGALLLALLSEVPNTTGIGTDIEFAALECARANAVAQSARAAFIACDYGSALAPPFDIVVSNPPYIPTGHIAGLSPEVREFDPKGALDGGRDGLDGYRAVATDAARLLAPDGVLVVELGYDQAEAVASLFHQAGLAAGEPRYDFSGNPRALPARLRRGFRA